MYSTSSPYAARLAPVLALLAAAAAASACQFDDSTSPLTPASADATTDHASATPDAGPDHSAADAHD